MYSLLFCDCDRTPQLKATYRRMYLFELTTPERVHGGGKACQRAVGVAGWEAESSHLQL